MGAQCGDGINPAPWIDDGAKRLAVCRNGLNSACFFVSSIPSHHFFRENEPNPSAQSVICSANRLDSSHPEIFPATPRSSWIPGLIFKMGFVCDTFFLKARWISLVIGEKDPSILLSDSTIA